MALLASSLSSSSFSALVLIVYPDYSLLSLAPLPLLIPFIPPSLIPCFISPLFSAIHSPISWLLKGSGLPFVVAAKIQDIVSCITPANASGHQGWRVGACNIEMNHSRANGFQEVVPGKCLWGWTTSMICQAALRRENIEAWFPS